MSMLCRCVVPALLVIGAVTLLVTVRTDAQSTARPVYTLEDLGTLGGSTSHAYGINDLGHVVGEADTKGNATRRAFLWIDAERGMSDLGALGGKNSVAYAINNRDDVVGAAATSQGIDHAFLWSRDGGIRDLGSLPGGAASRALAISNFGVVVGEARVSFSQRRRAVRWVDGRIQDLGIPGVDNVANGINDAGQIVGSMVTSNGEEHAFLWVNGQIRDLGTLPGGIVSRAFAINRNGVVVGAANRDRRADSPLHAFVWSNGEMRDLGTLTGPTSEAFDINDVNQVVGSSSTERDPQGRRAFFFSPQTSMLDLNTRIDYFPGETWVLRDARAISNAVVTGRASGQQDGGGAGQAAGTAVHNGAVHAYSAKPGIGLPRARLAVFRPSTQEWIVLNINDSVGRQQFGTSGDRPVPADYLGGGRAQIAVFRPGTRQWLIRDHHGNTIGPIQFGELGDIPVPADYLSQGHAQIAVFRPNTQEWRIRESLLPSSGEVVRQFGGPDDVPVPADYQARGHSQIAVFRPSTQEWFIRETLDQRSGQFVRQHGGPNDLPVPADYLGLGYAQIAVFRPRTREWFIRNALSPLLGPPQTTQQFGDPGDRPFAIEFSQLYRDQLAVFHSNGSYSIHRWTGEPPLDYPLGIPGDEPVPGYYLFSFGN